MKPYFMDTDMFAEGNRSNVPDFVKYNNLNSQSKKLKKKFPASKSSLAKYDKMFADWKMKSKQHS